MAKNIKTPSKSPARPHQDGFTLLEVIVSVLITGVGLTAVFGTLQMANRANHHARCLSRACLIAEQKLIETQLAPIQRLETQEGHTDKYYWQVQVKPSQHPSLAELVVTVTWQEQNRSQQFQLFNLVPLKPLADTY